MFLLIDWAAVYFCEFTFTTTLLYKRQSVSGGEIQRQTVLFMAIPYPISTIHPTIAVTVHNVVVPIKFLHAAQDGSSVGEMVGSFSGEAVGIWAGIIVGSAGQSKGCTSNIMESRVKKVGMAMLHNS